MNWNNKIVNRLFVLIIPMLFPFCLTGAQDISAEIEKAFLKGDIELLRDQFDDKVRLIILGQSSQNNKTEAIKLLNEFLKVNPALKFQSKFESEKSTSNFIIKTMESKKGSYRVTVFFVKKDGGNFINLLRIEKENESVF
ncbi:MAG: DUF4783 domain-containing protein [Bacteroidales bacterium]|nr:DUF4783 domain-containing protein [Bacteroidales bacterium]MCF8389953.1 DUF4783 domain-containing protein [Bacteroidales bacterium]